MAGTSNSITSKNVLVGSLSSDNTFSGLVNTAFNPAYALVTQAGAQIVLNINNADYKMYAQLKDKDGNLIYTSNIIDLPLETMVVNGEYDSTAKEVVLTLDNGNKIRFSVADLVSGLVSSDELETTLADYVKNTDYGNDDKAGAVKSRSDFSFIIDTTGRPYALTKTYSQYLSSFSENAFISKGTLENVITGKGLVSSTDYANNTTGGVIKTNTFYGTATQNDGNIRANTITYSAYGSMSEYAFIGKGTLENVLNARIGDIGDVLDEIQGEEV